MATIVAACAPGAPPRRDLALVGQVGPNVVEGRIRVVGSAPFAYTVVQPEGSQGRIVTGAFKGEIRRLAGAQVRVTGALVQDELPDTTLNASSYEVLSIDGDRPMIGELERDEAGFYLSRSGQEVRRIGFVSERLAGFVGGLVWVVLDENDGVATYGILREVPR